MPKRYEVLLAWAKANPIVAAVYGAGTLFAVVLLIVIISAVSQPSGPTEKDLSSLEQEPNIAKRVRKLNEIEKGTGKPSTRYTQAMGALYEALTRSEALPEDILILSRAATEAEEVANEDFAWMVVTDSKLRRGVWPKYPEAPPQDARVATTLREVIARNPRINVALPADLVLRERWLRFAVEGHEMEKNPKAVPGALLGEFYKDKDTQENQLMLYQQLSAAGAPAAWLAQRMYDKLGLLPEPLYVLDNDTTLKVPQLSRGPDNTLMFLGVLEGERCAIGMEKKPLPLLWVRPCKGLEPRRLARGELFLLGVDSKYDAETPMHWLPLLLEDDGKVAVGTTLRGKVDDRVLASFIVAAPRFVLEGKAYKAFPPALDLVTASSGLEKLPSFKTGTVGKPAISLMAFAASAKAKWLTGKGCGRIEKDRCDPLRGAGEEDRCEVSPAVCIELPGGAAVRWAKTTVIRPEPCLKEYGHKSNCKFAAMTGVLVDVKNGPEFVPALHAQVHEMQPPPE